MFKECLLTIHDVLSSKLELRIMNQTGQKAESYYFRTFWILPLNSTAWCHWISYANLGEVPWLSSGTWGPERWQLAQGFDAKTDSWFYCFLERQVASPLLALDFSFERTRMSHECQMFSWADRLSRVWAPWWPFAWEAGACLRYWGAPI